MNIPHGFAMWGPDLFLEWILKMMKNRSELGLGSALFGISDPGLIKKGFFETLLSKNRTGSDGHIPVLTDVSSR